MTTPLELFDAAPHDYAHQLRRELATTAAQSHLPGGGVEYGWSDGGCLILADALVALLAPAAEVVPIVRAGTVVGDHYVTRVGELYLDDSGGWSRATMLARWERVEVRGRWRAEWSTMAAVDIYSPREPAASGRLAEYLARAVFDVPWRSPLLARQRGFYDQHGTWIPQGEQARDVSAVGA